MKKIIAVIFLATSVYANQVVDLYRDGGMEAVEKYIKAQLQTKEYWESKINTRDVTLGYYEDIDSVLIANKEKKKLSVYRHNSENLELLTSYEVIVGANGDKQKEGDLKTPLGVYDITKRFNPSDPFYGPLAYALSYPNTYDKVQGKNGYGIWIHGSPLDGSDRDPMSKGCIVLDNPTIEKLDTKISPTKAITIVSENGMKEVQKEEVSLILAELFRWKNAWKNNDLNAYLAFYHNDFKRYDGMRIKEFSRMKKSIFKRKQEKEIVFKNINIAPYPNEGDKRLFKVAFYEEYKSKRHRFRGNKELFIELNGKSFSILSER